MKTLTLDSFTTFGELLKYLRQRERLTQRELGLAVGYGEAQINRLESGVRLPDVGLVVAQFITALHLADDPKAAARLIELAAQARGEPVPASFAFTRSTHRELVEEISRLRSERQGNLPAQVTSFVGREAEIVGLTARVKTTHLLTLTGAGGCGKTRLSLEVAALVQHDFQDGVWLVQLSPITDETLVPSAVAAMFRLPGVAGAPPIESLTNYLASKHVLLILDNCEHLIDACAQLAERLLRDCPNVHLLATSRESLRIAGEVNWRVPSLPQDDSIRLFIERAYAIRPDFDLTDHNAAAVARICQQLDGIPLAIELAAARLNALSLEQIAERLSDRFALLMSRNRTATPRHQTLHATIGWSFELLPTIERDLLTRLSVFAGGFTAEAAEAIFEHPNTFDLLSNLVDKSLVIAEVKGEVVRYRMLETIRQFVTERLRERGKEDEMRDLHLAYFLKLAETAEIEMRDVKYLAWGVQLEKELDNLRAALTWSLEIGEYETGLRLTGALWLFWFHQERMREGLEWADRLLQARPDAPASVRAKALYGSAMMMWRTGEWQRMATRAHESLPLCRELDDPIGIAFSLVCLGVHSRDQLNFHQARVMLEEAIGLLRAAEHIFGTGFAKNRLGEVLIWQGEFARAESIFEETALLSPTIGWGVLADGLCQKLRAALAQDDFMRANTIAQQHQALAREGGQTVWIYEALYYLGHLALQDGDYGRATEAFEACLTLWQEASYGKFNIGYALANLGLVSRLQGDYAAAMQRFNEAAVVCREVGDDAGLALVQLHLGYTLLAQGGEPKTLMHFRESVKLSHKIDNKPLLVVGLAAIAEVLQAQGDARRALQLCGVTANFSGALRVRFMPAERADFERALAAARARLDDPELAVAWAEGQQMTLNEAVELALSVAQTTRP